jgi:nucleoside 2-deoxyribosyltransferase
MMSIAPYVHVIMPIGSDPLASSKKVAIAKGVKEAGLEARFPDYADREPKFSLAKLIKEMRGAECVIADLSRERPSCYYELGIAEAIGKRVYLIAEAGTQLHQSAARSLVGYYKNMNELVQLVARALKEPVT